MNKAYGSQCELGILALHELPGLLLCDCLAGVVAVFFRIPDGVFFSHGIPVFFGVSMAWTISFFGIVNSCKGAGDDLGMFSSCVLCGGSR